jgi:acyl-CoA reductase-like NAD-dependent aldehyde dehydrogenase
MSTFEKIAEDHAAPPLTRAQLLIDGAFVDAASGETFEVSDPATESVIGAVSRAGAADVDRAIAAARAAFDHGAWRRMPGPARARIMHRFADLMEAATDELAKLETRNNGMPLAFAFGSIGNAVNGLRWYAGAVTRIGGSAYGAALATPAEMHAYTSKEPVGVAALITPWNGPIGSCMIKLSPALASGCSIVLKPSELTPLTALRLAELAHEAGLPKGVLNVIPGFGHEAGAALAVHPGVDKISFTGSTAVGKEIVRASAGNLKRVSLELGGKSPCVVFDDADMEIAIPSVTSAITANSGQVCFAGSRLFVQRKSFDRVVAGVGDRMRKLKLGSGSEPDTNLGPLISSKQRDRVQSYIRSGLEDGAELVEGGQNLPSKGYFVAPSVFTNTRPDMKVAREEIFGPVLVATPFDDPDEVPAAANATPYGLGAGIFTTNVNTAHRMAARIAAGNVWINCYSMLDAAMPFGGFKESGWGREMSEEGVSAFLETKSVWLKLSETR